MNFQEIAVVILFLLSLAYIGRMLYRNLAAQKNCGSNCKCGVDFSDVGPASKSSKSR